MPQPPGNDWLCRTGHGFSTSKNRNATNTPNTPGHVRAFRISSNRGSEPIFQNDAAIQLRKQTGIAVISSNTTLPGSFWFKIFSPSPHSHTDKTKPAIAPAMKTHKFAGTSKSANQRMPTKEPKVPGARGIRPTPKP